VRAIGVTGFGPRCASSNTHALHGSCIGDPHDNPLFAPDAHGQGDRRSGTPIAAAFAAGGFMLAE
jgi:hypothetical protein